MKEKDSGLRKEETGRQGLNYVREGGGTEREREREILLENIINQILILFSSITDMKTQTVIIIQL